MTKIWRLMAGGRARDEASVAGLGSSQAQAVAPREAILGGAAARDLGLVGVGTVLVFVLASRADLLEHYLRLMQRLERWQADELVFALTWLALGLMWYALRRWHEARAALALHRTAEQRVRELLAHNRELAQRLIAVQEHERRALARELHDELGQRCTALRVEAALVERALPGDPAAARAAAGRIDATAAGLYGQVREMLHRLRPAELDALGLLAAIQALCERWETSSGVACVFHHEGPAADWQGLGDGIDVTIFRVVQEGLSNVMRHAGASQVRIALRRESLADGRRGLLLTLQDNGRGMDTQAPQRGLGLLGARERAALLGGELQLISAPRPAEAGRPPRGSSKVAEPHLLESPAGQGLQLHLALPWPSAAAGATP